MRSSAILLAVAVAACGSRPEAVCAPAARAAPSAITRSAPATASAPIDADVPRLGATPLAQAGEGLFLDPSATPAQRARIVADVARGREALAAIFGAVDPVPVVACTTDACMVHFAGPSRRPRVVPKPMLAVVVDATSPLLRGTVVHELTHVVDLRRLGEARALAVPTWFHEGLATYLGDNIECPPDVGRAVDDLSRLSSREAWEGFTNMTGRGRPAYCQVKAEVAAWVARHDRRALVGILDAVAQGRSFEEAYGPIVTAVPPEAWDRSLDSHLPFDEDKGTDAADTSGRSHIATLMRGAVWTTGRRGAAVKVHGGSYVRADGLAELGVPDSPFTISLWVKPLALANVLVHHAAGTSGGDGFCYPLLGHDAEGRLVAQVSYAPDPKAFLVATGPKLPLRAWSHVAMTWTGEGGIRLYVDGKPVAAAPPPSPRERHRDAPASPMYLFLGSDAGARCWTAQVRSGDWNGAIDEVRVYDYALGEAELAREAAIPSR